MLGDWEFQRLNNIITNSKPFCPPVLPSSVRRFCHPACYSTVMTNKISSQEGGAHDPASFLESKLCPSSPSVYLPINIIGCDSVTCHLSFREWASKYQTKEIAT